MLHAISFFIDSFSHFRHVNCKTSRPSSRFPKPLHPLALDQQKIALGEQRSIARGKGVGGDLLSTRDYTVGYQKRQFSAACINQSRVTEILNGSCYLGQNASIFRGKCREAFWEAVVKPAKAFLKCGKSVLLSFSTTALKCVH